MNYFKLVQILQEVEKNKLMIFELFLFTKIRPSLNGILFADAAVAGSDCF